MYFSLIFYIIFAWMIYTQRSSYPKYVFLSFMMNNYGFWSRKRNLSKKHYTSYYKSMIWGKHDVLYMFVVAQTTKFYHLHSLSISDFCNLVLSVSHMISSWAIYTYASSYTQCAVLYFCCHNELFSGTVHTSCKNITHLYIW